MRDKLVEPMGVPEIFVDGFSNHVVTNGVMACAGYRIQTIEGGEPQRVVVVRLVWPAVTTDEAIDDAREAQASPRTILPVRDRSRPH